MDPIPLPKLFLAVIGAAGGWSSYQAYRARHRNPSLPQDPVTDRWWRRFFLGCAIVGADLVIILVLDYTVRVPHWLLWPLMGILAVGVLLTFAASFMIGWRNVN